MQKTKVSYDVNYKTENSSLGELTAVLASIVSIFQANEIEDKSILSLVENILENGEGSVDLSELQ